MIRPRSLHSITAMPPKVTRSDTPSRSPESTPYSEFILTAFQPLVPDNNTPVFEKLNPSFTPEQEALLEALVWHQTFKKGVAPPKFSDIGEVVAWYTHIYSTPQGDSLVLFKFKSETNLSSKQAKALMQKVYSLFPTARSGTLCLSF